ncbi:MAG: hypothetical protein GY758_12015, partial [Fuerstiella sp.]|nr:hypothetical protein [Fuerstiella sp.]
NDDDVDYLQDGNWVAAETEYTTTDGETHEAKAVFFDIATEDSDNASVATAEEEAESDVVLASDTEETDSAITNTSEEAETASTMASTSQETASVSTSDSTSEQTDSASTQDSTSEQIDSNSTQESTLQGADTDSTSNSIADATASDAASDSGIEKAYAAATVDAPSEIPFDLYTAVARAVALMGEDAMLLHGLSNEAAVAAMESVGITVPEYQPLDAETAAAFQQADAIQSMMAAEALTIP